MLPTTTAEPTGASAETYCAAEVAELLGVHVKTVYRWFRSGALPGAKVGGTWRISAVALERLVGPGH